jgi:hypothetical protein
MITGSQFLQTYRNTSLRSWEAAALELAKQGQLLDRPFVNLNLSDPNLGTATLLVRSDALSVGTPADNFRLPLTPSAAQSILNLTGELLPTPLLAYRIWQQAPFKLQPVAMVPNQGANLDQYAAHSKIIDGQIDQAKTTTPSSTGPALVAGIKKHVVVSNLETPGRVLIFGWYRPTITIKQNGADVVVPAPDVFDDRTSMANPQRQPIQPRSNVHGDLYVDYSHGIQGVYPMATVNGQPMLTEDLYRHPTLSKLVSNEGPLRVTRYPSPVPVTGYRPGGPVALGPASYIVVPTEPTVADEGFVITRR